MSILYQIDMKGLTGYYDYYINERADPRTKDWLIFSSTTPFVLLSIIATYIYIVKVAGPRYMENRKHFELKKVLIAYNLFQIIACGYNFYLVAISGWLTTKFKLVGCDEVDYSDSFEAKTLTAAFYFFFLLKLSDLVETVFFVMRKKYNQVSVLHVYHHSVMLIISWLGVKYVAGGATTFAMAINSLVHVIMYSYYLLALGGPAVQKKLRYWKQMLTTIQMVQFTLIILHGLSSLAPGCNYPKGIPLFVLFNVVVIFYLFYDFYKKSYIKKPSKNK